MTKQQANFSVGEVSLGANIPGSESSRVLLELLLLKANLPRSKKAQAKQKRLWFGDS